MNPVSILSLAVLHNKTDIANSTNQDEIARCRDSQIPGFFLFCFFIIIIFNNTPMYKVHGLRFPNVNKIE